MTSTVQKRRTPPVSLTTNYSQNSRTPHSGTSTSSKTFQRATMPVALMTSSAVPAQFEPVYRPHLEVVENNVRSVRKNGILVRVNKALQAVLVLLCGVTIVGYGLDVATSHDVGRLQEQARRLNEQNSEMSANLLKQISYQGIQDSVVGRFGLRVPEQVIIVKELNPPAPARFKAARHHLPLMTGF